LTFGYVYLPRSKSPLDGLAAVANWFLRDESAHMSSAFDEEF